MVDDIMNEDKITEDNLDENIDNKKDNRNINKFSTCETILLVIIALVIGLSIGALFSKTNIITKESVLDDEYLQEFIKE